MEYTTTITVQTEGNEVEVEVVCEADWEPGQDGGLTDPSCEGSWEDFYVHAPEGVVITEEQEEKLFKEFEEWMSWS